MAERSETRFRFHEIKIEPEVRRPRGSVTLLPGIRTETRSLPPPPPTIIDRTRIVAYPSCLFLKIPKFEYNKKYKTNL